MPQTKFQDLIYTLIMVVVMVYAMVPYNVAFDAGLTNDIFLLALRELPIMGAIAFVLEFFLIGRPARAIVAKRLDLSKTPPLFSVAAISAVIVCFMCPVMSFLASLLFGYTEPSAIVVTFLKIFVRNFPMALCWQIFYAGPFVRFLFGLIFRRKRVSEEKTQTETPRVDKSESL